MGCWGGLKWQNRISRTMEEVLRQVLRQLLAASTKYPVVNLSQRGSIGRKDLELIAQLDPYDQIEAGRAGQWGLLKRLRRFLNHTHQIL
jgi:hypothetical protein